MTEKELREIKRRFRPEKSNIPKIVGCFVGENGEIISRISQSMALSDSILSEKLLGVMKKTLSGTLGTNLTDIAFSTKEVTESEEHGLLMTLVKSGLSDESALDVFYKKITENVKLDGAYVILLANDKYDVMSYHGDGTEGESSEMFSYIVSAICPLKNLKESITFGTSDSLFHLLSPSGVLCAPELGFMFPAFDDRKTNIYNALYYTRSLSVSYPEFTESIFAHSSPMPPKVQKENFGDCLTASLADECNFEVVKSVHARFSEMIEVYKESKDPEPLTVSKATVKEILADCGVAEEKIEKLSGDFDEKFGKNAELSPKNIVSTSKFDIKTPEVSIKVSPEYRDIVSTQTLNNQKYVMIKVTGPVEVNGIEISLED